MGRFIGSTIAACVVLTAGCSSSAGKPLPSTEFKTGSIGAKLPDNGGLTGFGATIAAWNSAHQADPDPQLDAGCCYLPKIESADGSEVDTWQVPAPSDRMTFYTRNFTANTSENEVLSTLTSGDLPPDAKQIQDSTDGACRTFLFSSDAVEQAVPDSGSDITVVLFSPAQADPYDPANVAQAQLTSGNEFSAPC